MNDMRAFLYWVVRRLPVYSICLLIFVSASASEAQSTCPPSALLSLARAGAACAAIEAGEACYGSGSVSGTGLTQLGDRVALRELTSVSVTPGEAADSPISIASLVIRTSPQATDTVTVILIQNAELRSDVIPPVEMRMYAVGTLYIRTLPTGNSESIAELGVDNGVVANGRTGDNEWFRVSVPSTGAVGWVSAALVRADGNIFTLPVATPGDVVAQPFEIAHFSSGNSTSCDGALPAGALLQTPSTDLIDAVTLTLNSANFRLAGTAFLSQNADGLRLIVLDGVAELRVGETAQYVPAGAQITAAVSTEEVTGVSSAVPYDTALTAALPVNNLPRRFQVTPPQTQAAIDAQVAALTMPTPTPVRIEATPVDACRRSVGRDATVWSGPGEIFEALRELEAGTQIRPILAYTNAQGELWWQLRDSGWVARAEVIERGNCAGLEVPVTDRVPAPPTNNYSLERCESFNGPVRIGQRVTIEFIPPAWPSYAEALESIRNDPGRFEINSRYYRASASDPIPLGENVDPLEDRYLRRFTIVWIAEPGTYRITGDWLSYEPSCNLTVPAE